MQFKKVIHSFVILILLTFISCSKNENQQLSVDHRVIASEFSIPWGVAVLGDDELLITDSLGTLYHHKNGNTRLLRGTPQTYHVEFTGLIYGGLMDVSLHPNFDTNRLVYISYVSNQAKMLVARFKFQDNTICRLTKKQDSLKIN